MRAKLGKTTRQKQRQFFGPAFLCHSPVLTHMQRVVLQNSSQDTMCAFKKKIKQSWKKSIVKCLNKFSLKPMVEILIPQSWLVLVEPRFHTVAYIYRK